MPLANQIGDHQTSPFPKERICFPHAGTPSASVPKRGQLVSGITDMNPFKWDPRPRMEAEPAKMGKDCFRLFGRETEGEPTIFGQKSWLGC